jgi:hypothetical protein
MTIFAVDPGLTGCGWALWEGDLVAAGFVAAETSAREASRWGPLAQAVLSASPKVPDKVVVETMRTYTQGKSDPSDLFALQGLAGALLGTAHGWGMATEGYLAMTWKGQVPRDVMGARVEKEIAQRGWNERIRWPSRKTWRNDVCHAIALSKFAATRDSTRVCGAERLDG